MNPLLRERESALSADSPKVRDILASRDEVVRLHGQYAFDDPKTDGEIACNWRISRHSTGLNVRGRMEGMMEIVCSRCLENYPLPVSLEINEHFVFDRFVTAAAEREQELREEDLFENLSEEGELDLRHLAYQFLVMTFGDPSPCEREECQIPLEQPV